MKRIHGARPSAHSAHRRIIRHRNVVSDFCHVFHHPSLNARINSGLGTSTHQNKGPAPVGVEPSSFRFCNASTVRSQCFHCACPVFPLRLLKHDCTLLRSVNSRTRNNPRFVGGTGAHRATSISWSTIAARCSRGNRRLTSIHSPVSYSGTMNGC